MNLAKASLNLLYSSDGRTGSLISILVSCKADRCATAASSIWFGSPTKLCPEFAQERIFPNVNPGIFSTVPSSLKPNFFFKRSVTSKHKKGILSRHAQ